MESDSESGSESASVDKLSGQGEAWLRQIPTGGVVGSDASPGNDRCGWTTISDAVSIAIFLVWVEHIRAVVTRVSHAVDVAVLV